MKKAHYAILDRDIIRDIKFFKPQPDTQRVRVKPLPKGKNITWVRWDGEDYIDLRDLDVIYVDEKGELHCIPWVGTQAIEMSYAQRKYLTKVNGIWKIQSTEERNEMANKRKLDLIRRKRSKMYPDIKDFIDAYVKLNSGNEALQLKGKIQMDSYIQKCIKIKTDISMDLLNLELKELKNRLRKL